MAKQLSKEEILMALTIDYGEDIDFLTKVNKISFGLMRYDNLKDQKDGKE